MKIYLGKRGIEITVKRLGLFGKGIGLMFRGKESENLLFEFRDDEQRAIHSYFVFFDFLALWLNDENRVIKWQIVKPFTFRVVPSRKFRKLVEIPVNSKNRKIIQFFTGKNNFRDNK